MPAVRQLGGYWQRHTRLAHADYRLDLTEARLVGSLTCIRVICDAGHCATILCSYDVIRPSARGLRDRGGGAQPAFGDRSDKG